MKRFLFGYSFGTNENYGGTIGLRNKIKFVKITTLDFTFKKKFHDNGLWNIIVYILFIKYKYIIFLYF